MKKKTSSKQGPDPLYKDYFSKSFVFLYKLLGIPRNSYPPLKTAVAWKNRYLPTDRMLICQYDIRSDQGWLVHLSENLLTNKRFRSYSESLDGKFCFLTFSFAGKDVRGDWDLFLAGKYSQWSAESKEYLRTMYGYNSVQWAYIESFLYPERFFQHYANRLEVNEEDLREVGELCNKYRRQRESFPDIALKGSPSVKEVFGEQRANGIVVDHSSTE